MKDNTPKNRRAVKRNPVKTEVEFFVAADIIRADSMDMSEKGIKLSTDRPIEIELRFTIDGRQTDRKARLCWVRKTDKGNLTFGFEYVSGESEVDDT